MSARFLAAGTCAWSPSGTCLAVGSRCGVVVWRFGAALEATSVGDAEAIDQLAFAGNDSLWVATAEHLRNYSLSQGDLIENVPGHLFVRALDVERRRWAALDGRRVVVGRFGRDEIQLLARPDREVSADEDCDDLDVGSEREPRLAFAPDGRRLLVGYDDGGCWMFELEDGSARELARPSDRPVTAVAWSRSGQLALVAGGGRFTVFEGPRCKQRKYAAGATSVSEHVDCVAFAPRETEVAIASNVPAADFGVVAELEFIDFDAIANRPSRSLGMTANVPFRGAAYHPSGGIVAAWTAVGGVELWDARVRRQLVTLWTLADRTCGLLVDPTRSRAELVGDPKWRAPLHDRGAWPVTPDTVVTTGTGRLYGVLSQCMRR